MKNPRTLALHDVGQPLWLDNITRVRCRTYALASRRRRSRQFCRARGRRAIKTLMQAHAMVRPCVV